MTASPPGVEDAPPVPASSEIDATPTSRRTQLTVGGVLALLAMLATVVAVARRRTG